MKLVALLAPVVAMGLVACAEAPPSESKELSSSQLVDSESESEDEPALLDSREDAPDGPRQGEDECEYRCVEEGLQARILGRCGTSKHWGTHNICGACGSAAQTARGACPEDDR